MPLEHTTVFHRDWSTHHQPTADGQMLSRCRITRPTGAGAVFDELAGRTVAADPTLVFEGECREQILNLAPGSLGAADRDMTVRQWRVSLPAGGPDIQVNDLVEITESVDDSSRVGAVLQVVDVGGGTLHWQRDLTCHDYTPTSR